ncbi:aminoglycoside phosphotransferase APH(3') [Bifidobacterium ramosum]|uniref:Phosphotransferase n=1 Tax=Bifidobacterium ramosum TaxID=1798158 RepID=A0A6L4WX68_9BIFI|nr:aminoglycoside 3'-phosphotransferase [Bifidobacterium ramosum]KAB8286587.1 aminoglycoside phosphotransferase APH(3') [Bifidobacterium ramosum]NEG72864.1 phosphotransferase [Bifidobacterium ramosum]
MRRTELASFSTTFPDAIRPFIDGGRIFDSSSSPEARVYYSTKDDGYFIKTAAAEALRREAHLTAYFHRRGLAAAVLRYGQDESGRDWMVTARIPGEDCASPRYLQQPERLTELLARRLRMLHDMDYTDCPDGDRLHSYLTTASRNHTAGHWDTSFYTDLYGNATVDEIYAIVCNHGPRLHADVLVHGDYCLPNVILDDWRFTGFVDLDCAGISDRHVDVYWALWTLRFNLYTDRYHDRFLDAYGRDLVDEDLLRTVAAIEVFG